ncbi:MAG TPA: antibiotic biosynthesis monooxygenase [Microthrixaceae bacterium]|nr:antibiotic biosynthesis monooxygenase [Microthrixaceae bacterium]
MSIVRINAIEVPEGMGEMLEERFSKRLGAVDGQPGFEGFELLRPTGEAETRYYVVTHWRSVDDFEAWMSSADFGKGHAHTGQAPVGTGSALLEFDVVMSSKPE